MPQYYYHVSVTLKDVDQALALKQKFRDFLVDETPDAEPNRPVKITIAGPYATVMED